MESITVLFNEYMLELGHMAPLVAAAVSTILMLLAGLVIIKVVLHVIRRLLSHTSLDAAVHTFIVNTCKAAMLVVLVITILSFLGLPTTSLVTLVGACGAAVALALKDSLSNFAGGILILVSKPFNRGDLIETGNTMGRVQNIDLLYTTLLTLDYRVVTIPNGLISTQVVTNHTKASRRRVNGKFGISYESDIEKAKKVLRDVIDNSDLFLQDPPPIIGVSEHGDSAVMIDTLVWCSTKDYYDADYYLKETVKLAFDEAGIEIPYSNVTVHLDHAVSGPKTQREITDADRAQWRRKSAERAGAAIEEMDFEAVAAELEQEGETAGTKDAGTKDAGDACGQDPDKRH